MTGVECSFDPFGLDRPDTCRSVARQPPRAAGTGNCGGGAPLPAIGATRSRRPPGGNTQESLSRSGWIVFSRGVASGSGAVSPGAVRRSGALHGSRRRRVGILGAGHARRRRARVFAPGRSIRPPTDLHPLCRGCRCPAGHLPPRSASFADQRLPGTSHCPGSGCRVRPLSRTGHSRGPATAGSGHCPGPATARGRPLPGAGHCPGPVTARESCLTVRGSCPSATSTGWSRPPVCAGSATSTARGPAGTRRAAPGECRPMDRPWPVERGSPRALAQPAQRLPRRWLPWTGGCRGSVAAVDWWLSGIGGCRGLVAVGDRWLPWTGGCRGSVAAVDWWLSGIGGCRGLVAVGDRWLPWTGGCRGSVAAVDWWLSGIGGCRGLVAVRDGRLPWTGHRPGPARRARPELRDALDAPNVRWCWWPRPRTVAHAPHSLCGRPRPSAVHSARYGRGPHRQRASRRPSAWSSERS
ncbi:hypothetical protein FB559_1349 [Actinoallomurus bryophytorum]|uniref:Uncharacterized protein n=1 Tax=Actinoallomurus bryophytorum TaxID=1490222 RepID=A0A543CFG4_9ACTN|nr:hypothetical protein FB559_1349 [Actinoallomurus bryophytorum]